MLEFSVKLFYNFLAKCTISRAKKEPWWRDIFANVIYKWASSWQNQQNGMCAQRRQISLGIRPVWSVFTVRSVGSWGPNVSSCGQLRLWSDWADARADLSLCWVHSHFVGFVMRQLKCFLMIQTQQWNRQRGLLKIIRGQFSIVLHKNVYYEYSLASWFYSKEYPQHIFLCRNNENYP